MNYKEFYKRMAEDAKITPKQAEAVIHAFASIVMKQLKMGRYVTATNFGTFFVEDGNMHFKPSKTLLNAVNGKIHFKPSKALLGIVKPSKKLPVLEKTLFEPTKH